MFRQQLRQVLRTSVLSLSHTLSAQNIHASVLQPHGSALEAKPRLGGAFGLRTAAGSELLSGDLAVWPASSAASAAFLMSKTGARCRISVTTCALCLLSGLHREV